MIPQIIYLVLVIITLPLLVVLHGHSRSDYNFWSELTSMAIQVGLLYWGGFFDPLCK